MVSQLLRSKARKDLTTLCANSIMDHIRTYTSPNSSIKLMQREYISALNITLGNAVEAITGQIQGNQRKNWEVDKKTGNKLCSETLTYPYNGRVFKNLVFLKRFASISLQKVT